MSIAEDFFRQHRKGPAMTSVTKIGLAIQWETPVWAYLGRDSRKLITGPGAALRFLRNDAKNQTGRMHKIAVNLCGSAPYKTADVELSRAFFVAACDEECVFNRL